MRCGAGMPHRGPSTPSPGKDRIKHDISRFDDALVRDQVIDEFRFWIRPVVGGAGQWLF